MVRHWQQHNLLVALRSVSYYSYRHSYRLPQDRPSGYVPNQQTISSPVTVLGPVGAVVVAVIEALIASNLVLDMFPASRVAFPATTFPTYKYCPPQSLGHIAPVPFDTKRT
jgi:hypothetical protein